MTWAPDYVTNAELTAFANAGAVDSAWVDWARTTASRAVDSHTHRQFGQVAAPEARMYTARWSKSQGGWLVDTDDLMTLTGLAVAWDSANDGTYATTVAVGGLRWLPWTAAQLGRPWERFVVKTQGVPTMFDSRVGGFRVTASWGWAAVPTTVAQATALQANRLIARRDGPYGVAGSPSDGSEIRLMAKVDPDVAVTLAHYRRRTWAR
jgi:hypothetical protein